ncbi:dihydroxyacetone kinase subunit DhaL [Kaistia terrae]|uniref:Dihydroxyacetone kinase subunit DhaL n=1 Tax=Kaistia terrae TaxID=537017 RepID=A0ABW0Q1K8_9HYPH|nr:dihydroxyacetone kinase subunit DhaL [Kaistia terrae]MCX5579435.1 dihydroxyacetone kinase subunit DhaL [Kaistia terrae]
MKKLMNATADVVDDMIAGLAIANPGLVLLEGERVVLRADIEAFKASGRVALISGGGSGHEPAHAGYIGEGLLTAAVCGDVFTSPSTDAVLAAIRAATGLAGALLIAKNYTGDRLNFGLAAEIARSEGFSVDMVVVADDVALAENSETAGRRGIAGTVLVHKIAGAAAAEGLSLGAVKAEAERAITAIGSMGVALSACTVPAAGKPGFTLGDDEIELGLGIHGEAGISRSPMQPAHVLVETLLGRVFADKQIGKGDHVALLVNNLGATPVMEMQIVVADVARMAARLGVTIDRLWVGTFLTALEMAGCSLSAMKVDDALLARLDAPASAPAWPGRGAGPIGNGPKVISQKALACAVLEEGDGDPRLAAAVRAVADALIADEARLTDLDQKVGDGDLGLNLARGAEAILREVDTYQGKSAASVMKALSASLRKTVGGTSGALYAAGLLRAASELEGKQTPGFADWAKALAAGSAAIAQLGDAKIGDRTMLDALLPAADMLSAAANDAATGRAFGDAIEAARQGAAATAAIASRRGRSSYLGERAVGVPDPGAEAVVVWLLAIRRSLDTPG